MPGPQTLEEHVYNGASALTYSVYHVFGPGAVGGLSGSARHPATPAFPRGGMVHGPLRVAELVDPVSGNDEWKYRYEDQLGSLIGMADDAGNKLADYVYLDYGRAIERPIAFDGDHDLVNEGSSWASLGTTFIELNSELLEFGELLGMQFAVAGPANGEFYVGTVTFNEVNGIEVDDPEELLYSAVIEGDLSFVVYDFVDTSVATSGTYHTVGEWTSNPSYSSPSTTFTDSGADFKSYMVGWLICVKVENFTYLEITDVPSSTTIKVKGDADTLAASGDRYWLFAPPHVDPSTGAARGSNDGGTFIPDYDTHYLWGLYRYQPPMTGYYVDPDGAPVEGVYGAQTGTNQAGTYHAGARTYDPQTGRWTTPDPASQHPSLFIYASVRPTFLGDPTGLAELVAKDFADCDDISPVDMQFISDLIAAGWTFNGGLGVNVEGDEDSDSRRSVDDRWEIDYDKKEVNLDYGGPFSNKCVYISSVLTMIKLDLKSKSKGGAFQKKHGKDDESFDAIKALNNAEKGAKVAKEGVDGLERALKKGKKELPDSLGKLKDGLDKALKAKKLFDVGKDCLEFGEKLQKALECGSHWTDTMTSLCVECLIHVKGDIPGLAGLDRVQAEKDCKELKGRWESRLKEKAGK